MNVLIFDMDGVLLQPLGYHRALQETVCRAGLACGFGEAHLSFEQIARFEALGISSEWLSSALCVAAMQLAMGRDRANPAPDGLDLETLFEGIAAQPVSQPALQRGRMAVERLAHLAGADAGPLLELLAHSEDIDRSPTLNIFQELILGSHTYADLYRKPPQLHVESYLTQYDRRRLSEGSARALMRWIAGNGNGAAIMTNRPSDGPADFRGDPDAELGAQLVGLSGLPLVGFGEITWLAGQTGRDAGTLNKPAAEHALAAVLAASGWTIEDSLLYAVRSLQPDDLQNLQDSTITVFEDTPGGLIAVEQAGERLRRAGLRVMVRKVGVADDPVKQAALMAHGAVVYADIEAALVGIDDFGAFAGD